MRFSDVYHDVIAWLQKELPPYLGYHNAAHTISVVVASVELGRMENLTARELLLVQTAALFHDTGFVHTYKEHEAASCRIAREKLPQYDYTSKEIEAICELIMATKLPQLPANKLEEVLCDADLNYFGSDNYTANAENLYKEFTKEGIISSRKEWAEVQIQFLNKHHFFTAAAIQKYNTRKIAHRKTLMDKSLDSSTTHKPNFLLQDILYMASGIIISGFGLKGFLVPNQFFDGGISGLALLLHELYHFNLAWLILVLNLPLLVVSYFSVGKAFAIKTLVCVILLGVCLQWIPYPVITSDKLLISIFGGVFLGIGIGLIMRAGCALDGIEVLALYTLKRTSFSITEIILGLNILIFGIAAFKFGVETALYSILTYFAASRMIDYVAEGIQAYTGVTIISAESEAVKRRLVNELKRGITVYKGQRGFLPDSFDVSSDVDIVFTVVTRLELRKLKNVVNEVDPKAFVFANTIREAAGGILKRRQHH